METDDIGLVREALAGKTSAFGALVERYQKVVFNVAYRMTRDYDEAQDIAQVAFVKAYENLARFDPKYRFFSWLYRIAINETLNRIKSKQRLEELNTRLKSDEKDPAEACGETDLVEKIQDALMEIEPKYRILLVLRHLRAFSYKDIGDAVGIPEGKVKSRLFTARRLLRTALISRGIVGDE